MAEPAAITDASEILIEIVHGASLARAHEPGAPMSSSDRPVMQNALRHCAELLASWGDQSAWIFPGADGALVADLLSWAVNTYGPETFSDLIDELQNAAQVALPSRSLDKALAFLSAVGSQAERILSEADAGLAL